MWGIPLHVLSDTHKKSITRALYYHILSLSRLRTPNIVIQTFMQKTRGASMFISERASRTSKLFAAP